MNSSPLILSAMLHLVIASAIWGFSGDRHAQPPALVIYLDLASVALAAPAAPEAPQPALVQEMPETAKPEEAKPEPAAAAVTQEAASVEPALTPQPAPIAPEISQAFASASRMQEMMYNTRRYQEVAGMALRKMLEGKLPSEQRRQLSGKSVRIVARYPDDTPLEIAIETESEELRSLLQDRQAWAGVPSPQQCRLQYKQVAFVVSLERGAIQVGLSPQ